MAFHIISMLTNPHRLVVNMIDSQRTYREIVLRNEKPVCGLNVVARPP